MKVEIKLDKDQFNLLLAALYKIGQGLNRLNDSWCGNTKEEKEENPSLQETTPPIRKRLRNTRSDDVGTRTIMRKLGMDYDSKIIRAACALCGVQPFFHGRDGHLYIKKKDEVAFTKQLKKII